MSFLKDQGPKKPSHLAQAKGREGRGGMELEVSTLRGWGVGGGGSLDNATQPVAAWEQT